MSFFDISNLGGIVNGITSGLTSGNPLQALTNTVQNIGSVASGNTLNGNIDIASAVHNGLGTLQSASNYIPGIGSVVSQGLGVVNSLAYGQPSAPTNPGFVGAQLPSTATPPISGVIPSNGGSFWSNLGAGLSNTIGNILGGKSTLSDMVGTIKVDAALDSKGSAQNLADTMKEYKPYLIGGVLLIILFKLFNR